MEVSINFEPSRVNPSRGLDAGRANKCAWKRCRREGLLDPGNGQCRGRLCSDTFRCDVQDIRAWLKPYENDYLSERGLASS